jgi:hypothetical protein
MQTVKYAAKNGIPQQRLTTQTACFTTQTAGGAAVCEKDAQVA